MEEMRLEAHMMFAVAFFAIVCGFAIGVATAQEVGRAAGQACGPIICLCEVPP